MRSGRVGGSISQIRSNRGLTPPFSPFWRLICAPKAQVRRQNEIRPGRWYFGVRFVTLAVVIRLRGAASIAMGRTPHEMHDEMCSSARARRV